MYPVNYVLARGAYQAFRHYGRRYAPYVAHSAAVAAARYFRPMPRHGPGDVELFNNPNKKRRVEVGSQGNQLSYSRIKHGKKVAKREMLMRILAAKLNTVSHRWQNITNSASGSGAYTLEYVLSGAIGSQAFLPVFMFDLTGAQQQVTGGSNAFACVASRLNRTSTGSYFTAPIAGIDSDNAGNIYTWTTERSSGLTNTKEYSDGVIENVSIKLLLYGARKVPSKVKIQLVSFEEGFTPSAYSVATAAGIPSVPSESEPNAEFEGNDWNAHWGQHIAPLIGNPISTRPHAVRKIMNVHMTKEYNFQPKLSTELDVTGDQVAVYFNYKMNKRMDYTRAQLPDQVTTTEEIVPNEWAIMDSKELSVFARPQQRIFLLMSGMTPTNTSGVTNGSLDQAPSFDICLRRKISCIDV